MLAKCPNCKFEFFVGDEIIGECPNCKLKLLFKGENEVIEKVNIEEIERKVDEIIGEENLTEMDIAVIEEIKPVEKLEEVEKKVDEL